MPVLSLRGQAKCGASMVVKKAADSKWEIKSFVLVKFVPASRKCTLTT